MRLISTKVTTTSEKRFEITREELLAKLGLNENCRVFIRTSQFTEWDIEDQPIIIISTVTDEKSL